MATKSWTGAAGGLWSTDSGWSPYGVPTAAEGAILALSNASFAPISGTGSVASLTVYGEAALSGSFAVAGALTVGSGDVAAALDLLPGTVLTAGSATLLYGPVQAKGAGTRLAVSGAFTIGGAGVPRFTYFDLALSAVDGAAVQVGSLVLAPSSFGNTIAVDAASSLEIGAAGGAAAGMLTIDAGGTLSGLGVVSASGGFANAGTILAQGGTLLIAGAVNGTGRMVIADGATLDLFGGVSSQAISFAGAGGTLDVSAVARVAADGTVVSALSAQGVISGFVAGDSIVDTGTIASVSYQSTGFGMGTLTLSDGTGAVGSLMLAGDYRGYAFQVAPAASGGDSITLVAAAPPPVVPFDFNGDGRADLLLQNDDGAIVIETQANLAITNGISAGNPGAAWHIVGSGDFNGDGQADILLQNTNGAIVDYLMAGTGIAAANALGSPGPGWHVRGVADFNADGHADILLQNDDGTMVIWQTDGTSVTAGILVGAPGPDWHVEAVADLNGDGVPDILLQNGAGQLVAYTMNGSAIASGAAIGTPVPGWAVAGTGNYNGTGQADILLHNDGGADVLWQTNGAAVTGASLLSDPGASWTGAVAGVDLNGDGTPDLVLQNTDSSLVGFTIDGTANITAGALLSVPGAGWHATGPVPTLFIDGTGANANLAGSPGADQFDLSSTQVGLHQISAFDPAQDSVVLGLSLYPTIATVLASEVPYQGGTFIALAPGCALVILGVTPDHLGASNFVLR